MSDPRKPDFSGAKLKLQRAYVHIDELDAAETRFLEGHPLHVRHELDMQEDRFGYVIYQRREVPKRIGLIIGDAIHNMRSALDHAVSACTIANSEDYRHTLFPWASNEEALATRLKDKVRKAGAIAEQIVRDAKPYPGGNDALWRLHEFDLIDKHRVIVAAACASRIQIFAGHFSDRPIVSVEGRFQFAHGKEEFVPGIPGYEMHPPTEIRFSGEIVFGPETPSAGEPCVAALKDFLTLATDIVAQFEAKF